MSILLVILVSILLFRYFWSRRHLYLISLKLNGPSSLPLIGSTYLFIFCKTQDLLQKIYDIIKKYDSPLGFWLGPDLVIIFKEPQELEKIMSSSKFSHKHTIYDLMKDFLGDGLITASGPTYKSHKKIIQPFFSLQFATDCIPLFEKHMKICVQKLEEFVDKDYFDIGQTIHYCTADITGEAVLGYNFQSQEGNNLNYIHTFTEAYSIVFERFVTPWLHPTVIFNLSSLGKQYKRTCLLRNKLINKVTKELFERHLLVTPFIDQIAHHFSIKEEVFSAHLITLYMAAQDTIAIIVSAACLCFGMYPQYQAKVVQEIYDVIGKEPQHLRVEDLSKLPYLDMCVKDIFRLFPIAPYILRKNLEDQQLGKWFLPKGCGIGIPIYNLHKNVKYWSNPDDFHPDHFLPHVEQKRPIFAYMPFSAGPRGCIGKVFANVGVKVMIINLLQRYEIEAKGRLPDVKFTMDISVRSQRGYSVKIKRRTD